MRTRVKPGLCVAWCTAKAAEACALALLLCALAAAASCGDVNGALKQLSQARSLSADLLVQFTKASDAANRAVMADTDEASIAFAREAEQANAAVQKDVEALGPLLQDLHHTDEIALLQQFVSRFESYRELDRRILDLAVENTNLKAQRLSFGAGDQAATAFSEALEAIAPRAPADAWRLKAVSAAAVGAVREIQVLQAPHIADGDNAVMGPIEKRMATSETAARQALATLATIVEPASRPHLAAAVASLDQFMALNAQIIALSRRNTNVRSLALSLDEKPPVTAACEESLRALRDALAKRGYPAGR